MTADVPELVRQRALSRGGEGRAWLDALPTVLRSLEARWRLTLGRPMTGGTASLVVEATTDAGRLCVVKVFLPEHLVDDPLDFENTVVAHRIAAGRGCVRLLDHDPEERVLLLERLGPNLHTMDVDTDTVLDVVADTLLAFWRPVDRGVRLPTGADKARWLAEFIASTWTALDEPCPAAVVDRALALCTERAAACATSAPYLVHGDAHGWNTLSDGAGGYKLIDPEGLQSEREHDLGVLMREYNAPLLAGDTAALVRARARRLAHRCDVDVDAVWQWGYIERVSTGLANLRDFDDPSQGQAFLEVAARCS